MPRVVSEESVRLVGDILCDKDASMARRTRALFTLKAVGGKRAVEQMERGYGSTDSELLLHEICYVIGQLGEPCSVPFLSRVVSGAGEPTIARHEAAEALGAVGDASALGVLARHAGSRWRMDEEFTARVAALVPGGDIGEPLTGVPQELEETCEIALGRILWIASGHKDPEGLVDEHRFGSTDPTPALPDSTSTEEASAILLDTSRAMFTRYCALFLLRNRGGEAAVRAICASMKDPSSALLRHEAAFVLGQMQDPSSAPDLAAVAKDAGEAEMVRHEAAEALGAMGTLESQHALEDISADAADVVRESVEVALDIHEYETGGDVEFGLLDEVEAKFAKGK